MIRGILGVSVGLVAAGAAAQSGGLVMTGGGITAGSNPGFIVIEAPALNIGDFQPLLVDSTTRIFIVADFGPLAAAVATRPADPLIPVRIEPTTFAPPPLVAIEGEALRMPELYNVVRPPQLEFDPSKP